MPPPHLCPVSVGAWTQALRRETGVGSTPSFSPRPWAGGEEVGLLLGVTREPSQTSCNQGGRCARVGAPGTLAA